MEKVLTVVVPAYNAQDFLRKNLSSFCNSSILSDIDILIINDGSSDNTRYIAEEYMNEYPNSFRVINKENGGHGSGINVGIQNAQGRYFKVVDADDWVDAKAFEKLVQTLKTSRADVIYSGFLWAIEKKVNGKKYYRMKPEIKEPFKGVIYEHLYEFDNISQQLYMKMHNMTIRTDILRSNNIKIDEHCYYVDLEFITYPIPYVQTIYFLKNTVYYYRVGSCSQSVNLKKMQSQEENYNKVLDSLLAFYTKLSSISSCTSRKKAYIASIIGRAVSGKIKIMLSFPRRYGKKQQLKEFDSYLLKNYPEIYCANLNLAVDFLRESHYWLFSVASILVKIIYL